MTYPEIGATRGPLPAGEPGAPYHQQERRIVLRALADSAALEAAAEALLGWRMHRRAGLRVPPGTPPAAEGLAVRLRADWLGLWLFAPCRVVYLTEEPSRRGFAYGTLPGHPESGEESFHIELGGDGELSFVIRAFSRPAIALARAAGPIGRWIQSAQTDRYLHAMRDVETPP